jgi:dTDP-4-amino-4,6-dideoxygalactose transaminase
MPYIAPAGTPISAWSYATALLQGSFNRDVSGNLALALARHSGHSHCWLMSTGRAAMVVALQAMRDVVQDPRRTEVIVAGYTCYSVAASVLRAGLKPRLCDVDPDTLSLKLDTLQRFDCSRVLAIISANLYGIPNALGEIESFARRSGIYLLDDAAQALGASFAGRAVGGFGDVGLYSFDKGKNITSLDGGALVASDAALAGAIESRYRTLPRTPVTTVATTLLKLAAYSVLLPPTMYGLVRKLPFLGLGKTIYEDSYPLRQYNRVLAGFAGHLYTHLERLTQTRRGNADALTSCLASIPGLDRIQLIAAAVPGYTRLPIFVRDPSKRTMLVAALDSAGIGATTSYPEALSRVPELAAHLDERDRLLPGAHRVAERIVTLPVHPYCPPGYAQHVARTVSAALGAGPEQ